MPNHADHDASRRAQGGGAQNPWDAAGNWAGGYGNPADARPRDHGRGSGSGNGGGAGPDPAASNPWRDKGDRVVDPAAGSDARMYSTFLHLTLLAVHVIPIPVIPALVMWLIKRNDSSFIDDHGREAINFQITVVIYGIIAFISFAFCGLGIILAPVVWVYSIAFMVVAAVAANKGEFYRYPACIRFLS